MAVNMYTAVAEQNPLSWIPVAVAAIAALSAVAAQLVTRLGEPRRLRMLKSMNEAIIGYKSMDRGRAELVAARKALAHRTAAALLKRPPWLTFLNAVANILLFLSISAFVVAAFILFTDGQDILWTRIGGVGIVAYGAWALFAVFHYYADQNWQKDEIPQ